MTNLVSYDPFTDTGMDELFRGFFAPVRRRGRADAGHDQDGRDRNRPMAT